MPRRHKPPESTHSDRWMVSYADFMTLLFAFFVVMYAMSVVNNQKFERMSHALVGIFESSATLPLPVEIDNIIPSIVTESDNQKYDNNDEFEIQELQNNLQALVQENIKELLTQPEFQLENYNDWLQIEVQADRIFKAGTSKFTQGGEQTLVVLAKAFEKFDLDINIEVYTDITNDDDLNDWQLSAAQGASIAYVLTMEKIAPTRLAIQSYGPYHPIATNDDEEGKAINRRVIFMIDRTGNQRNRTKIVTDRHLSAKPILEAVN
jgi:chemotaxis protein MotB